MPPCWRLTIAEQFKRRIFTSRRGVVAWGRAVPGWLFNCNSSNCCGRNTIAMLSQLCAVSEKKAIGPTPPPFPKTWFLKNPWYSLVSRMGKKYLKIKGRIIAEILTIQTKQISTRSYGFRAVFEQFGSTRIHHIQSAFVSKQKEIIFH